MLLDVSGIFKSYGNVKAVQNISFGVHAGEIFGLIGPNGAGKTTILEIIEGIRKPDIGEVKINGRLLDSKERALQLGVQIQENALFDLMTVEETVVFFALTYKLKDIRQDDLLEALGLSLFKRKKVIELSIGQQRRLCILLAFLHQPSFVILDEPSSGLDPLARRELWDLIKSYVSMGDKAVLLSTHYMDEAESLCGRVALLNRGQFVGIGNPLELIKQNSMHEVISFNREATLDETLLLKLPDTVDVRFTGNKVIIETDKVYSLMRNLLDIMEHRKMELHDLQIRHASLEDVFLKNAREEFKE